MLAHPSTLTLQENVSMNIYVKNYHYYNRYLKFIESRNNKSFKNNYEKHHIIPKSMGGTNDASNIIKLSFREHFIAHWLLWKAFQNAQMIHAFWFMNNKQISKISSRVYCTLKESRLDILKNNKNASGKRSLTAKLNMSLAQLKSKNHTTRGKIRLEFAKQISGINNPMYGKISPTKGKTPHKKIICPFCKKEGAGGGMTRFHFQNCKFIQIHTLS